MFAMKEKQFRLFFYLLHVCLVAYHSIIAVSSVVKITAHNDTFLLLWQRSDLLFDKTYEYLLVRMDAC
jgi:hypothetical protein